MEKHPMELMMVDPRALKENPDKTRRTKSTPQSDALLLATIKAVGIIQPPIIQPEQGGGNGYTIHFGHRRVAQAIAADLAEIQVLVADPDEDRDAMRALIENVARDPLNPVDLWRSIERLVALGWTEESIALALALPVRQIRKLRLLANVLPAMLDQMARGDMPAEQNLRTIAAASQVEQAEVWKKYKPKKVDPTVYWHEVARALTKTRVFAKHASFGDDLAQAYGIVWQEDLFAPADEDSRYTNDVEAFYGAQQEWLANNLPKRGSIVELGDYGQPKLPAKAERVYGKPGKGDHTAWYVDSRSGEVQSIAYRLPEAKKAKDKTGSGSVAVAATQRPDVTRKGMEMIGDLRTDALHEAFARAPIEDGTLMALLVLAFAGMNVSIASGSSGNPYAHADCNAHAARLIGEDGKLNPDRETLQQAVRSVLIDVLSCRENRSASGIVARIAGEAIGADEFLPNMGTDDFLSCLSRAALEASLKGTQVLPRNRVKDTRAALVDHFAEGRFVHPAALFAPKLEAITHWVAKHSASDAGEAFDDGTAEDLDELEGDQSAATAHDDPGEDNAGLPIEGGYAIAAE
jgi:ParB family chromosome partitioning protein